MKFKPKKLGIFLLSIIISIGGLWYAFNKIDLNKVFLKAYNIGIGSIIIEGGKTLTKSVLKDKLINEFYLFKSIF